MAASAVVVAEDNTGDFVVISTDEDEDNVHVLVVGGVTLEDLGG
jgi:hypothetical protein